MILGLCGPKHSGKTELAKLLVSHKQYERVALGDGLKHMLLALYEYQGVRNGHARRMLWGDLKEEPTDLLCGRTSRHGMQTLGTEWGRDWIHPDLWVNVWKRRIQGRANVVAEDVRFENEIETIRGLGGKIIRVDRPGYSYLMDHRSEQLTSNPDFVIHNVGPTPDHMIGQLRLVD